MCMRWNKKCMGTRPCSYLVIRPYTIEEETIRGERREKGNLLRWDYYCLSLPGDSGYNSILGVLKYGLM